MVQIPCRIILLAMAAWISTLGVQSQLDSNGFLSIDCGLSGDSSYVERKLNLTYVSDDQFINTGIIANVSSPFINMYGFPYLREYTTVRYFPTGVRNCYTIGSLILGYYNFLIRAIFNYGNYDNLNKPPMFDLYLGIDFWTTVNASSFSFPEIIRSATSDHLDICLVNKNQGVPFITSLHLRMLTTDLYQFYVDSSLILMKRDNIGGSGLVRYPDDLYDRWWRNYSHSGWKEISTNSTVDPDLIPEVVMQTAATTSSTKEPLTHIWKVDDPSTRYIIYQYYYDVQKSITGRREFDVYVNRVRQQTIIMAQGHLNFTSGIMTNHTDYNVSLVATPNSTLPPLLNAFELYNIIPVSVSTYAKDVAAINSVKDYHKIKKGWSGDPCLPMQFSWTGIVCSSIIDPSNIQRITSLNLSSSLLTGSLCDSIGNLTALQYLYLSNNNLFGSIPNSLGNLKSLKLLDIRGNPNISTILPPELESKRQSGALDYRTGDYIIPSPFNKKDVAVIAIGVGVPLLIIAISIALFFGFKKIKDYWNYPVRIWEDGVEQNFPKFKSRQFSYNDLKKMTSKFKNKIGSGGFGSVYLGNVEGGVKVAVKVHSHLSAQGVKEVLAEAESLTQVHHKYLVALMGYCIDRSCMALVYEYMPEGDLYEKLKDNENPFPWKQRLQIAYESALGLEYLHKACNPPLIHRDIKTSNILLTDRLHAKISDFGLSRTFTNSATSHVSTRVVGTRGYLDPEYYLSNGQLTVKSDVFSFGVVLLEVITGRPPIMVGQEGGSLVQWVHKKLAGGDIKSIIDSRMQGGYNTNSIWKVANVAYKCTKHKTSERPTMTEVVAELKESLEMEISKELDCKSTENLISDHVSQDNISEIAYVGNMSALSPDETRREKSTSLIERKGKGWKEKGWNGTSA